MRPPALRRQLRSLPALPLASECIRVRWRRCASQRHAPLHAPATAAAAVACAACVGRPAFAHHPSSLLFNAAGPLTLALALSGAGRAQPQPQPQPRSQQVSPAAAA